MIDTIKERMRRVDESLARQLQNSIQRNSRLQIEIDTIRLQLISVTSLLRAMTGDDTWKHRDAARNWLKQIDEPQVKS